MNKEWEQKLERYYNGTLSEAETAEVEKELEKLDTYQSFIDDKLEHDETDTEDDDLSTDKVNRILNTSIRHARLSLIGYIIMILLLIYPLITLAGYFYYSIGHKGQDLIEVGIQTMYVTEPNTSTIGMDVEKNIGFFSMNVDMDLYKRIGKKDVAQGDWQITYEAGKPHSPKRHYIMESQPPDIPTPDTQKLFHPDAGQSNFGYDTQRQLKHLPEGTVAEAYVSLNRLVKPEDMNDIIEGYDVEWRWYAADTGLEVKGKDKQGRYLAPIGFPAQNDDEDHWSPYNNKADNKKQFLDSLQFLSDYAEQATQIARAKSLELDERIDYLEHNDLKTYGGVLTGPTKELLKALDDEAVRDMHIGEVRLWNW